MLLPAQNKIARKLPLGCAFSTGIQRYEHSQSIFLCKTYVTPDDMFPRQPASLYYTLWTLQEVTIASTIFHLDGVTGPVARPIPFPGPTACCYRLHALPCSSAHLTTTPTCLIIGPWPGHHQPTYPKEPHPPSSNGVSTRLVLSNPSIQPSMEPHHLHGGIHARLYPADHGSGKMK